MPISISKNKDYSGQTADCEQDYTQNEEEIIDMPSFSPLKPMSLEHQFDQCAGHRRVMSYNYQPQVNTNFLPNIMPVTMMNQMCPMCLGGNRMQNNCCMHTSHDCCCKYRQYQFNNMYPPYQFQNFNPMYRQCVPYDFDPNGMCFPIGVRENQPFGYQYMNEIPVYPQENIEPSITISNIDRIPQVYKNNQYRSQDCEINEEEQSITSENDKMNSASTLLHNSKEKRFFKNNLITQKTGNFTGNFAENESGDDIDKKVNESEEIKMKDNMYNNTSDGQSPVSRSGDYENEFNQSGFRVGEKGLKLGYTMTTAQNKNKQNLQDSKIGVFDPKKSKTQKPKPHLGSKQSKLLLKVTTADEDKKCIHNENFNLSDDSEDVDKDLDVNEGEEFESESLSSDTASIHKVEKVNVPRNNTKRIGIEDKLPEYHQSNKGNQLLVGSMISNPISLITSSPHQFLAGFASKFQRKNSEVPKEIEIENTKSEENKENDSFGKIPFVDTKDPKIKFRPKGCLMPASYLEHKEMPNNFKQVQKEIFKI